MFTIRDSFQWLILSVAGLYLDGGVTLRQFVESRKEWLEEQFGKMGNIMGVWG